MKVESTAFMLLSTFASAGATSLRGLSTPKATLLAQVDISPNAHVNLLEVDGNVVIEAEGDSDEDKDFLMKTLFNAKEDDGDDMDLVGFFKNLAGTNDVPVEVVLAADMMGKKKFKNEDDTEDPPAPPAGTKAFKIDEDDSSVVKHAFHEDGDRRRLGFCSTVPYACGCYTYLKGNYYVNYYDARVESFLQSNYGYVTHTVYLWNGYSWSRIVSDSVSSGGWSYLDVVGSSYDYWMVETSRGTGDSYNWAYC